MCTHATDLDQKKTDASYVNSGLKLTRRSNFKFYINATKEALNLAHKKA